MRNSLLLTLLALLLAGCGGGTGGEGEPAADASGAANPDDVVVQTETRLVDNPPTYESVPITEELEWLTNEEDPVFASPDAKRGGTYRTFITSFPLTLRMHGPDSNSGDFVTPKRSMFLSLVDLHPNTLKFIPSLATHWAFGADGKTVYYKLDPRARWSDGVPVTADDYVFSREFRLSEHIVDPFGQNHFTNNIVAVVKHDDYTISVHGSSPKPPEEMLYQYGLSPTPRHFHKLDANWVQNYNWRLEPTTGAYHIARAEKGRYIELKRTPNWWGDELKYNQNRFNFDTIRLDVIRDENVAFEYFLRGELDSFLLATPSRWHERAVGEPFDRGYIHKIQFYNDVPRNPRGLWLNLAHPVLADRNVRYGLAHAVNYDAVLQTVLRGDYERLRMHFEGFYWGYSHPSIQPRGFDLALADQYLDAAGWTEYGPDGIRRKDGQRLSFNVSYASQELSPQMVLLREEAKKAGVELNLQLLDPSAWGTQIAEKKHQIVWVVWGVGLTPEYRQHYHSDNAHVPNTNNITNTADPALDELIDEYTMASDLETRVRLSHRIQEIVHDTANFIPAYRVPYVREAYWRWLRLPEHYGTRISAEIIDPFGSGLVWLDEEAKAETLAARAAGRAFEPVTIVDETWRTE